MKKEIFTYWESIYGPRSFIERVISDIKSEYNIIITNDQIIPWKNEIVEILNKYIEGEYHIDFYNYNELDNNDFLYFILKKYQCEKGYRNIDNGIELLSNIKYEHPIFYLSNIPSSEKKYFLDILRKVSQKEINCLFIFSFIDDIENQYIKKCDLLDFDDYNSKYDVMSFCRIVSKKGKNDLREEYIGELAGSLFINYPEKALIFFNMYNLKNIYEIINEITCDFEVSNYHNIDKIIWGVQLKIMFPEIEKRRIDIIIRYEKSIKKYMPKVDNFGYPIEDYTQVELSILRKMVSDGLLNVTFEEDELIKKLYNYRNHIAHLRVINENDLMEFFNL